MPSLDESQSRGSEIRCPFLHQESYWDADTKAQFWRLAGDPTYVEESTWGSLPCDIDDSILLIDCDWKLLEGILRERITGKSGWFTKAGHPARFYVERVREGISIKVILERAGEGIITAYQR